jgi:CheY-like chemotaxis protein
VWTLPVRFCYALTVPGDAVLVIDDSPTILKVVQLVLTKAGFAVHTATDGEDGIRKAMEVQPSLILLDFVMPRMNGYQVCRALADSDELKDVPVVLMSAKGDQVGERFVKVMGIVDYITKPFSPEAITAVVQHTIAKYGAHPDLISPLPEAPAAAGAREATARSAMPEAPADPGSDEPALQGNLKQIPIAEVLSLLSQQRQWGVLSVWRSQDDHRCARVGARNGDPQEAAQLPDLDDEPAHLDVCFRQGKVELVHLALDEVPFVDAALGLDVDGILMEGVRRVDEWHLIEREVDDFEAVYLRNEEQVQNVGKARMTREELAVLELVNGKNTVKDIVRQSRMGSFDVSKMLFRLLSIKLIRRRVAPVAV